MKKSLTAIVILTLCLCFLTACGKSEYVGKWQLTKGNRDGTELPIDKLEELMGGAMTLTVEEDGTATLETPGNTSESVNWEETDDGIVLFDGENKENGAAYQYKDGQLVQEFNGLEMVFEKQ